MNEPLSPATPGSLASAGSVSVVIPVYNSEAVLPQLLQRLEPVLVALECPFEVILVNDGSIDRSWEVIQQLAQQHPFLRGVNLMRNYGQHNALLCGVRAAQYKVIVTIDDDLQHPPEEIPKLLAKLQEGNDVVYGVSSELPHSWWRNLLSRLTKRVTARVLGIHTVRDISAFRAFRTELRRSFDDYRSPTLLLDAPLAWGTNKFAAVEVQHAPRMIGRSNYTVWKLISHTLLMITGFSTSPLRIASLTGFSFTLFGLGVLIFVVGRYLIQGGSVPGFAFLASAMAIFSGAQLFAIGIIGEYLARIFARSLEKPTYVVRATTSRPADPADKNDGARPTWLATESHEQI